MLNHLLSYIFNRAILLYCGLLLFVAMLFFGNFMSFVWVVFGLVAVVSFFYYSRKLMLSRLKLPSDIFVRKLFLTALIIRILYVIFSYLFFDYMTGEPFEFQTADAKGYHGEALWLAGMLKDGVGFGPYMAYIDGRYSDMGYPLYLGLQYYFTDNSILFARILKAFYGAFLCVLVYRLATRNFGEEIGRLSAIFCLLMPNLVYYSGMHLKETEMLLLSVWYIERADYLLRNKNYTPLNILSVVLLCGSLFFFRTALGATAVLAFITALIFSESKLIGWKKKVSIGVWILICLLFFSKNRISEEVASMMSVDVVEQQENTINWRAEREDGNSLAKYVKSSFFAPLILVIPFPTIVETPGQENQRMIHGGNYIKNITAFFSLLALWTIFIRKKNWREHVLLISFFCGYLIAVAISPFAHSERFHLPALPYALIFAAYGIFKMRKSDKRYYNIWLAFIFVAIVGWSWFKLAGKGLI